MKRLTQLLAISTLIFAVSFFFAAPPTFAQNGYQGTRFVDENGDGYNDNAPDDDGDGIPNGQDPDFVKPEDSGGNGKGFVDADGDGVNDLAQDDDGDGIPNGQDEDYVRPKDGQGNSFARGKRGMKKFGFIDEDGDGINDRMFDDNGLANGLEGDWIRPEDCTGLGSRGGKFAGGFEKSNQGATGEANEGGMGRARGHKGSGRP